MKTDRRVIIVEASGRTVGRSFKLNNTQEWINPFPKVGLTLFEQSERRKEIEKKQSIRKHKLSCQRNKSKRKKK